MLCVCVSVWKEIERTEISHTVQTFLSCWFIAITAAAVTTAVCGVAHCVSVGMRQLRRRAGCLDQRKHLAISSQSFCDQNTATKYVAELPVDLIINHGLVC